MEKFKALFTSSGRRVELIEIFKQEGFVTVAADCDPTAPTLFRAHEQYLVPRVDSQREQYIKAVAEIIEKESIDVVIPLIDPELPLMAVEKDNGLKGKAVILISRPEKIDIAFDKYRTYRYFTQIGLSTPRTFRVEEALTMDKTGQEDFFPALLKPRFGSAGIGIIDCNDMDHVAFLHARGELENYILQQKVKGEEITTDIMGDGEGEVIAAVQRKRLKIRGGEVERGITVKYQTLMEDAKRFADDFKPFGPVNIQCFYDSETKKAYYIEINPRFGGGYPLAYNAGANFPDIVKKMLNGEFVGDKYLDYTEGLMMSRFDSAVYYKP